MRPFAALTPPGQARRLRRAALLALDRYDLAVARVRLLDNYYNAIFRVDAADGARYALRISAPGGRSLTDIRSELCWLEALRRDTALVTPEPLPARDGAPVVTVEAPGVPEPRHCVLFRWIAGRDAGETPTPPVARQLGLATATLHDHADRFVPPAGFTRRRIDAAWPFGTPPAIASDESDGRFPPGRRAVFRAAAERVGAALAALYADPGGLRFLHTDLHLWNAKLHRGTLRLLDFDDSRWCYPVQDLGIALFHLQGLPNAAKLRAAFLDGYGSLRPSPATHAGQLDTFVAARQLDVINFTLQSSNPVDGARLDGMIERAEARLRAWLERETSAA